MGLDTQRCPFRLGRLVPMSRPLPQNQQARRFAVHRHAHGDSLRPICASKCIPYYHSTISEMQYSWSLSREMGTRSIVDKALIRVVLGRCVRQKGRPDGKSQSQLRHTASRDYTLTHDRKYVHIVSSQIECPQAHPPTLNGYLRRQNLNVPGTYSLCVSNTCGKRTSLIYSLLYMFRMSA